MKHIKTYEELKPETYLSAADKLSKLGHDKRPEVLKSWGQDIKTKNLNKITCIYCTNRVCENVYEQV